MATVALDSTSFKVPVWVNTIDLFHEWLDSGDVPEKARVWFLNGEAWIDMSREQLDTHLQVKGAITTVLWLLSDSDGLGEVYPDGVLLTNRRAGISGNPDMVFVSNRSTEMRRVRRQSGASGGHVGLIGSPDMVLEVVSDSSVIKDNETLREGYWIAGITEYWLVDVRSGEIEFDILKRGPKGYIVTRNLEGWLKSSVFSKSFKLTAKDDSRGHPKFTLHVK